MKPNDLLKLWQQEEQTPFTGWDFSYLEGRMLEDQPPWSYTQRAADAMHAAASVLDMGTGGGERLLTLKPHWPAKVVVTEDYPPNVALARERLEPLGVQVINTPLSTYHPLPFADGEFDLVLNRHSGFNCPEVTRILSPGGIFLTQQVHGLWAQDLMAVFGATPEWPDSVPARYVPQLEDAGLCVDEVTEWQGDLAFLDVGALVYYLNAVPWLVPGFSVETHADTLLALHEQLGNEGRLVYEARKYLLAAHKPA